jgi:hypothetical protein
METRREVEDIINQLKDEVPVELREMRSAFTRLQAIENAVDTDCDPATWAELMCPGKQKGLPRNRSQRRPIRRSASSMRRAKPTTIWPD